MEIKLPKTSIDNYFTGITALNIPEEDISTGDWHVYGTFSPSRNGKPKKFTLSSEYNSINTNFIFGTESVTERGYLLKEFGFFDPNHREVYAADHYRAIADMLFRLLCNEAPNIEKVIILSDWMPNNNYRERFFNFFEKAKPYLNDKQWKEYMRWKDLNQ